MIELFETIIAYLLGAICIVAMVGGVFISIKNNINKTHNYKR